VVIVGRRRAPAGADLAASNCLLATAVLRLALDQPEADLASAVPLWLLVLHPVPLAWYWAQANVRRYCRKTRGGSDFGGGGDGSRRLSRARKLIRVSLRRTGDSLTANSVEDVQLRTVERITVV